MVLDAKIAVDASPASTGVVTIMSSQQERPPGRGGGKVEAAGAGAVDVSHEVLRPSARAPPLRAARAGAAAPGPGSGGCTQHHLVVSSMDPTRVPPMRC